MTSRLTAIYHVRSDAHSIAARAQAIAVEQSVEMPLSAIEDQSVLDEIVGNVEDIGEIVPGLFAVRIGLAASTIGDDAGQLINMLFGNVSLQDDVMLHDAEIPDDLAAQWRGPAYGLRGIRQRTGIKGRAFTCAALKPQGLPPEKLGELAAQLARGGVDFIKDDHGLASQSYSPFAARTQAVATALLKVKQETGHRARYVPSITGDMNTAMRLMVEARNLGIEDFMLQPMIMGLSNLTTLRGMSGITVFAHPAFAGTARIAPAFLFGKVFRMLGADTIIFPNHGGRFAYSPDTCRGIAENALRPWLTFEGAIPVPAGGMTKERVPEMLDFYGADVMLLIGGALLDARARLTQETAAFVQRVKDYRYAEGAGTASW